jgi:hypothetical protein
VTVDAWFRRISAIRYGGSLINGDAPEGVAEVGG